MDFALGMEHQQFKDVVRTWVDAKYPRSRARELEAAEHVYPEELWQDLSEAGFNGIGVEECYGGQGGDTLSQIILAQQLARNLAGLTAVWVIPSFSGARALATSGSAEQKSRLLPGLAAGRIRFAISVTEPDGGTDLLGAMRTTAKEDGDTWVLNGQKVWSTGAHVADYLLVLARSGYDDAPKRSMTLFLVPRSTPGVEMRPLRKLGMRALSSNEVFFNDVVVEEHNVLGEVGAGWSYLLASLNTERILTAAICTGMIEGVLEEAVQYAQERRAFGRPIGQFQAIQHYIADIATWRVQAELVTMYAAWLEATGQPCGTEATTAKLIASEYASSAADLGIQILGGMGYSTETDMQRFWRDARVNRIAPVTNEMARNMIAESLGLPRSY